MLMYVDVAFVMFDTVDGVVVTVVLWLACVATCAGTVVIVEFGVVVMTGVIVIFDVDVTYVTVLLMDVVMVVITMAVVAFMVIMSVFMMIGAVVLDMLVIVIMVVVQPSRQCPQLPQPLAKLQIS